MSTRFIRMSGLLLLLIRFGGCGEDEPPFEASETDRRMVVESMQNLSDYVGFQARFSLDESLRTLVMRDSDLCEDDFPQLIPPAWWRNVVDAGFETFECSTGHTTVHIKVQP